ncbi:vancomycin resistance protein VanJ [Caenispirillum bisanense]|uniref:Vancomycin resistance protein VanJ n=1 Tax=Caenispirillum bisanense TaxID=414052 RepID=A0A286GMZ4_9PROT|nr:vancomycin resistance protein VanJ [Caenispirillum bisanense]
MTILAAGLAAVTLAVLAARLWWPFDLLTHFRLQYLAAALALLLLAMAAGARPAAVLLVVVLAVHGWAVRDLWLPRGDPPLAADALPLTVFAANVLAENPRPEAVVAAVRDKRPDIVVLVDARGARWREPLARLGALYPQAAPDTWAAAAGPVVILSRFSIRHERLAPRTADRPPYLLTTMTIAGRAVTVVGVHPTSPEPFDGRDSHARNRQLDRLGRHLARIDGPAIVAGDFNTSLWSPHARALLRAAGLRPAAAGFGWHATWPLRPALARVPLDHVLVRGPIAVTDFRSGPPVGSDHLPVAADLRLEKAPADRT